MKLSEAIRLGATMKPQIYGSFETSEGTCAYGAAFNAIGKSANLVSFRQWPEEWNKYRLIRECLVCNTRLFGGGVIAHLNDNHKLTRESIADYVEILELEEFMNSGVLESPCVLESPSALPCDNADVVVDETSASIAVYAVNAD